LLGLDNLVIDTSLSPGLCLLTRQSKLDRPYNYVLRLDPITGA